MARFLFAGIFPSDCFLTDISRKPILYYNVSMVNNPAACQDVIHLFLRLQLSTGILHADRHTYKIEAEQIKKKGEIGTILIGKENDLQRFSG